MEDNSNCDADIKARIGMVKANFGKTAGLLTNMGLSMQLRLRILTSCIWSGLLSRGKSRTIRSDMEKKLDAVDMWFMRRMIRVPWFARRT